jgi:glycerate kinase
MKTYKFLIIAYQALERFGQKRTFVTKFSKMNIESVVKNIFNKSVDAVKPSVLISGEKLIKVKNLNDNDEIIEIRKNATSDKDEVHTIASGGKNIKLIGIGKAVVLGAAEFQTIFKNRLSTAILSVPAGATKILKNPLDHEIFRVFEGAHNNLPDADSMKAAIEIKNLVENSTKDDILFFLISGGGSALCPLPKNPITLDEKTELIKKLANCGANINELNIVRIALSELKGGKLAALGKNAHQIVTLIISDIVGDPLELIASGPTVPYKEQNCSAKSILEKYNLIQTVSPTITKAIKEDEAYPHVTELSNSVVVLMGTNRIAIRAAIEESKIYNLNPVFLSSEVQGNVQETSKAYFDLAITIRKFQMNKISEDYFKIVANEIVSSKLCADLEFIENLSKAIKYSTKHICVVAGGETTVHVTGLGYGGRNQELALRFTKLCYEEAKRNNTCLMIDDLILLSAGTDGVDGMNDPKFYQAAGAIGGLCILSNSKNIDDRIMDEFINNNDSYNFYKNILNYSNYQDSYHIITGGYTGTNVMDIHLLIIPNLS